MNNNPIRSILEYSAKELVNLAKSDTPTRYTKRQSLGIPKVTDAYINYNNGSAIITVLTHDHYQQVILEDFVQLVADEVLDHLNNKVSRTEIVKLVKLAVRVIINDGDILVDCDCDDYKYRFNWVAKQYGYAAKDRIQGHNYSPDKTNPKLKGGLCKHLIRVLSRVTYWNDAAGRKLINDLLKNKEFVSLIDDKLLDKENYSEDKDYDQDGYPTNTKTSDDEVVEDDIDTVEEDAPEEDDKSTDDQIDEVSQSEDTEDDTVVDEEEDEDE